MRLRASSLRCSAGISIGKGPVARTLWAICNIVSGTSAQTAVMVDLGAVSVVTNILRDHPSPDSDVVEQGGLTNHTNLVATAVLYLPFAVFFMLVKSRMSHVLDL